MNIINYQQMFQVMYFNIDFKKQEIIDIDINKRMILLGSSTIIFSVISKRFQASKIRLLRNTLASYFAFGTILVPEIFNPFVY
jgi:hypothetical protein